MPIRIALIGPGAIGGSLAAHLIASDKHDIALAARTPFRRLTLELEDGSMLASEPKLLSREAVEEPFDWVFIATKAYDVAGTAAWLRTLVGPATRVAVIQNGVEHRERFREHVPVERLLPVMIDLPAERSGAGVIRQRRVGVVRVPDEPMGREFVALFGSTLIDAQVTGDFTTVAWHKLGINAPGAINAILDLPNRIVLDPEIGGLMRGMILEVILVGRAEGAKLEDRVADEIIAMMRDSSPDGINSLHADRIAGRTMEADARNGAVVRAGHRHNIPTPLNTMAFTLLQALQPGPRSNS
jgi:2-dehydropantoate 2-reductase